MNREDDDEQRGYKDGGFGASVGTRCKSEMMIGKGKSGKIK